MYALQRSVCVSQDQRGRWALLIPRAGFCAAGWTCTEGPLPLDQWKVKFGKLLREACPPDSGASFRIHETDVPSLISPGLETGGDRERVRERERNKESEGKRERKRTALHALN